MRLLSSGLDPRIWRALGIGVLVAAAASAALVATARIAASRPAAAVPADTAARHQQAGTHGHAGDGAQETHDEHVAQEAHGAHGTHAEASRDSSASSPSVKTDWPEGPARTLRVGADREFTSIGDALAAASSGDTVRVGPGVYRENLRIERAVALVADGAPVVDGGGRGHVVEATAPLLLRGFMLRSSGKSVDNEDAGVMVRGARARVEHNRIEDVLYGVYLKDSPGSLVAHNRIRGKDLPDSRRGDGIRLWYSSGTRIVANRVERTRDVVIFFSDSLEILDNHISDGRYGLHYMYSDHNRFEGNRFVENDVGAFLMYSTDIQFTRNVFAESRGASGFGVGLKDADDVVARENLWVKNEVGIYLDNSPRSRAATNVFEENLIVFNDAGVRLLPSVTGNRFEGNDFVANGRPAEVSGGAPRSQAAQNRWHGNHWSEHAGFDRDGDGRGDTPYVHARLSDQLVVRHPELRLFTWSPAFPVVDAVSRFFPLLRPSPVVVDSAPRLSAPVLERWERQPPVTLTPPVAGIREAGR